MKNPQTSSSPRNLQFDCLRGVAILLVIFRHTIIFRKPSWDALLVQIGWAGVDLFFVLSGFLISGLLFTEYRQNNSIRFGRFAIRRALKIYPAFYALVLLTLLIRVIYHLPAPTLAPFLHDVFFLQSYFPGTYGHFWSLSVEEHFYILLPLLIYLMIRWNSPGHTDPFRLFPAIFVVIAIALLVARLWTAEHVVPFSWQTHLYPTHLRIDSLLFGVLLSYWAQFRSQTFWEFVRPRYPLFLLVGVFLISPGLVLTQETPWMYTYGFSLLYLGFGAILLGAIGAPIELMPVPLRFIARILAFVGRYSYSIYLWHIPLLVFLAWYGILRKPYWGVGTFVLFSIALGVLASEVFEIPAIKLRDKLFPQSSARVLSQSNNLNTEGDLGTNAENSKAASSLPWLN